MHEGYEKYIQILLPENLKGKYDFGRLKRYEKTPWLSLRKRITQTE
jgi:hypothetical protein